MRARRAMGVMLVTLAAVLFAGADALAAERQEPSAAEVQVARRLFREATLDEQAGRWAEAREKLREALGIKTTPGILFHLAVCEQNLGNYVEALNELGRAEELAQARGDRSVLDLVPERRQQIEAKLATLNISFAGEVGEVEVRLDGKTLAPSIYRYEIPLNPGEHEVTVRAAGQSEQAQKFQLAAAEKKTISFELTGSTPNQADPDGSETDLSDPPSDATDQTAASSGTTKWIVAGGAFAVGVAGVVMGFAYKAAEVEHNQDIKDIVGNIPEGDNDTNPCAGGGATPMIAAQCSSLDSAISDRDTAHTLQIAGWVTAGVGAAAGVAVLVLWPESDGSAARVTLAPTLGGLQVNGRF